jgi:cation transport ATPase
MTVAWAQTSVANFDPLAATLLILIASVPRLCPAYETNSRGLNALLGYLSAVALVAAACAVAAQAAGTGYGAEAVLLAASAVMTFVYVGQLLAGATRNRASVAPYEGVGVTPISVSVREGGEPECGPV